MKKILGISLILAVLLLTYACGADKESKNVAVESDVHFENTYSFAENQLPAPMSLSTSQYSDGQTLFFCGMDIAGNPLLIKTWMDDVTGHLQTLEYKLPEEAAFVYCCYQVDRRLIVLSGDRPQYSLTGTKEPVTNELDRYHLYLMSFTQNGNLISSTQLEEIFDQGLHVCSLVYLDGYYYILTQTQLIQTDSDGHVLHSLTMENGNFISQTVRNGELLICCFTGDGENLTSLKRLTSPEKFEFDDFYTIDSWQVMGIGSTGQGQLLINDGGVIYSLDTNTWETKLFFDFHLASISIGDYAYIFPYKDGYLLSNYYQDKTVTLSPGVSEERTELTLWSEFMIPEVLDYVRGFNQQNKDYCISVLDISDMNQEQIMGKIVSGGGPDLYYVNEDSVLNSFKPEQVFEDLNPLIAESAILPPGSILPDLQRCLEQDGKLYFIPVDFSFETVVTYKHPPVDNRLTFVQQEESLKASDLGYALFTYFRDASSIWHYLSELYMNSHIDEKTATCCFETPLFIQLLEYCSDQEANASGDSSQYRPSVYNFDTFPGPLRLAYFQQEYGDELQLVSDFGSLFYIGTRFGIANTSQHKDGAIEFLSYANHREPDNPRFTWPASTKLFQQLLKEYSSVGIWYENEGQFVTLTDNTIEQLYAMLANVKGVKGSHSELISIMDEEAQKCFAGTKMPQETAAQIQSRASIYLAEQYG